MTTTHSNLVAPVGAVKSSVSYEEVRLAHVARVLLLGAALCAWSSCQRPNLQTIPAASANSIPPSPAAGSAQPRAVVSERVAALLAQMTLEEKIGQMTQLTNTVINNTGVQRDITLDSAKLVPLIRQYHVGSFLNGEAVPAAQWVKYSAALQRIAMRESRLHIPIIYGIDHMHGASYVAGTAIFPHNLNLGASFNPEFARQTARATILESADLGHHWVFAPVLDLGVNTYWPRVYETYGEDPLVASVMGTAFVKELQENKEIAPYKVAACGKHFLGYSDPRNGWDRTNAMISEQRIQEFFRPSFQAAMDAGLKTVMINSGLINGEPVHASKAILTDLLRTQMGFKGVAVTDWEDIIRLVRVQKTAATEKEATFMAIDAGVDMAMTPYTTNFCRYVKELVQEGRLSEERINLSAGRVLQLKDELGLFEHPMPRTDRLNRIGDPALKQQALAAARESMVLLKNEKQTLPLAPATVKRLLVVGPSADSRANLAGGWTLAWQGRPEAEYPKEVLTIYAALKKEFPGAQVETIPYRDAAGKLSLTSIGAAARKADAVILAIGERPYTEGLGNTSDLTLPDEQQQLVRAAQGAGKPTVLVIIGGRPSIIRSVAEKSSAILWGGLPGFGGGQAVAEIISGKVNPSGKLSFTYPQFAGHISPYHHDNNENSLDLSDFGAGFENRGPKFKPAMLTEYGEGLSYTSFRYSNLQLSDTVLSGSGAVRATVQVTNTGKRAGKEAVLWFLTDEVGRITRPVRLLKHFEKQEFQPGESREMVFEIRPLPHLSYPNAQGQAQLEDGYFTLRVGNQTRRFRYASPATATSAPVGQKGSGSQP
ncbi:glycoside hydrolase family 3 N-terminal domain-containing protein [Hymenobacter cellulosivorans]|uniref:beta-glucosidase n=1 Tax=Hymenobacter cellulosivorans TaxID=2932249 RepID=A0ABY4FBR5_9BACT|nr:glycoside hydrolase family 3 N-terminal domain-containing protein [Hymenobacter cellulosivorans]UOQ53938.1 glycoside hydrolase family 3 C-terminal domain-containing protein [Hymenobacter cellulosivorans]